MTGFLIFTGYIIVGLLVMLLVARIGRGGNGREKLEWLGVSLASFIFWPAALVILAIVGAIMGLSWLSFKVMK